MLTPKFLWWLKRNESLKSHWLLQLTIWCIYNLLVVINLKGRIWSISLKSTNKKYNKPLFSISMLLLRNMWSWLINTWQHDDCHRLVLQFYHKLLYLLCRDYMTLQDIPSTEIFIVMKNWCFNFKKINTIFNIR